MIKKLASFSSGGHWLTAVRVLYGMAFLSLGWAVSGCAAVLPAQTTQPLIESVLPPPSVTISPTVVWFPPTNTPTPVPTIEATPTTEMLTGVGVSLYQDNFSSGEGWDLFHFAWGSAALGNNQLTLVILEPRAYGASFYNNIILDNFYLEITADVRLCADLDEYGLLIRRASPADFYRFSLSCDGHVRMDRIYQGTASSPQPWLFSSAVPRVPPSTVRLGVWVDGKNMRFFIDGMIQFEVEDPILTAGNIGVFARSGGDNAVTVNFSDLEIYQIAR